MLIAAVALGASLTAGALIWLLAVRPLQASRRGFELERAELEALAHEDPLTHLPNARGFQDRLDGELRRATRECYPVAVVLLDVGRAAGDAGLLGLADRIRAELRAGDIAARLGAGEFALALVRADGQTAETILNRIQAALRDSARGSALEQLELRAGVAEFPRDAVSRDDLVRRAGDALQQGERQGRPSTYSPAGAHESRSPERGAEAARERNLLTTLQGLAKAVDSKNRWTAGHSERVAVYAEAIARSFELAEERIDALRRAALLHDVGKIGIKESILTKEQPLNLEEIEELQRHSELGRAMLAGAGMTEIARWVHLMHERFDGNGYPLGLAAAEIPLESRILHAADALDQMTRPSAIRRDRPLREALAELSYCSGTRLDPEIAVRVIELVQSGRLKIAAATLTGSRPRRAIAGRPVR